MRQIAYVAARRRELDAPERRLTRPVVATSTPAARRASRAHTAAQLDAHAVRLTSTGLAAVLRVRLGTAGSQAGLLRTIRA